MTGPFFIVAVSKYTMYYLLHASVELLEPGHHLTFYFFAAVQS